MSANYAKSRLDILLRLTNVSGKTLSNSLHVDMSLVSRWKNGVRSLSNNGEQLEKICDYFVMGNHGEYLPLLKQIIEGESISDLKKQLAHWLLQPMRINEYLLIEQQKAFDHRKENQKFYISFKGNEGRRQAVLVFLENILEYKRPLRVQIMDEENYEWLREDAEFFGKWKEKMLGILARGHHLIILRGVNRQLNTLFADIVEWIPFYLTGQVSAYVGPQTTSADSPRSLYLLEDVCALHGFVVENEDRFTAFTNDPLTIQSHQNLFENSLNKSKPLIEIYNRNNIHIVAKDIIIAGENNDNSYYMANELFFTNMKEDLLVDLLKANYCTSVEEEIVLGFHRRLNQNFKQNVRVFENRHIYNYKSLEKCAKQASYLNSHLSIITGRPIYMSREHFIRHIDDTIIRLKGNLDFNVALTSRDQKAAILEDLDIWIKDGYFLCTWSNKTYEYMMISLEPTVTHAFTEYYQQLWESIPLVEKEKASVLEKFNKLLKFARKLEMLEVSNELK